MGLKGESAAVCVEIVFVQVVVEPQIASKAHLFKLSDPPGGALSELPVRGEKYEDLPSLPGSPRHSPLSRILPQRHERLPGAPLPSGRPLGPLHR